MLTVLGRIKSPMSIILNLFRKKTIYKIMGRPGKYTLLLFNTWIPTDLYQHPNTLLPINYWNYAQSVTPIDLTHTRV